MRAVILSLIAFFAAGCGSVPQTKHAAVSQTSNAAVEMLVFAPHPDDEALGCAGIIRQAIAAGKRVKIVIFTNGDGFPAFAATVVKRAQDTMTPQDFLELARFRQAQTQAALAALGGKPEDLIFLGYPDSALDQVYQNQSDKPLTQQFTQKSATYGVAQPDYHTSVHGKPAPYTHAAALADVVELIRSLTPREIYVTSESDSHRDHKAAFWFVRDAVKATDFQGDCYTYVVHGGPEWPWPKGNTPDLPLAAHEVKGQKVPVGVPWPPPRRVALTRDENDIKLKAINAHATHLPETTDGVPDSKREYFESFIKSEEVFWPFDSK